MALDNLDEVVALIGKASSPAEAKARLMERFGLTDIQSQAILDMRLQRLTGLERDKIVEEYRNFLKDIARFKEILGSEQLVLGIIKDELGDLKERFGDAPLSDYGSNPGTDHGRPDCRRRYGGHRFPGGLHQKKSHYSLQNQRRGGKGKTAMGTKDEDFVRHLFVASTHHTFLFFTNMGRVYWCKVYDIPEAGRTSRGKAIVNLLDFTQGEKLTTILAVPEFAPGHHIMMATKSGQVKKTDLMAYSRPRSGGIIALNLAEGDELISARITDGTMNVFLCSAMGKSIRFHETDVRPTGRVAGGIRGLIAAIGLSAWRFSAMARRFLP